MSDATKGNAPMGELLERYSGTAFALVPDDLDPEHLPQPEDLVQMAFAAGAETVLTMLRKRAANAFPAAIPALEALLVEAREIRNSTLSGWDLCPADLCPGSSDRPRKPL
jgi:hypothetical protein